MLTKAIFLPGQELLNKGSSNLPVEMMQSTVASRIKAFLSLSKVVSPKNKIPEKRKGTMENIMRTSPFP